MSTTTQPGAQRFGHFEVRPDERRVLVQGQPAPLGARAFDLLLVLIEERHRLVGKQELLDRVWPGLVVEENNLPVHVSALRKWLGPQAISTVPGRGYRFTAVSSDPAPAAQAETDRLPAETPPTPAHQSAAAAPPAIPWELALHGREADLARLGRALSHQRLISIVGSGGVGKTRLVQAALDAARPAFAQGAAWVELSALDQADHVVGSIGAALGLPVRGADALAALVQALRPLNLLLVLGNAEHLTEALARVAGAVLPACPGVHLLVTSQVPLHVPGEVVQRLEGLSLPTGPVAVEQALQHAAVALFCERASAADRRFRLDADNVGTVVEICRRLDGLPLAIELAAARVALLGSAQLLASLDERLQWLGNRHVAQPRQRSLRAALAWSHGLLDPLQQTCFRRLAVFTGGFTLDLAQQVLPAEDSPALDRWAVLDALGELVDRSLLALGAQDPPRYQLLESPRALALDLLAQSGEAEALRQRHARAVAAWFAARDAELLEGRIGMDAWLQLVSPEIDNGRAALDWACRHAPHAAVQLVPGLLRALTTARLPERLAIVDLTEPLLDDPTLPADHRAAWCQASGLLVPAATERRVACLRQAVALHRSLAQPPLLYLSLSALLGLAEDLPAHEVEDLQAQKLALESSLTLPPRSRMLGCQADYFFHYIHQQWPQAEAALLAQVEWARRAGHSDAADTALSNLADLAFNTGQLDLAVQRGRELLARRSGGRRLHNTELARRNLTVSLLLNGNTAEARVLARQGAPRAAAFMITGLWADTLALLAAVEQRPRAAAVLCGHADIAYRQLDQGRSDASIVARRHTEQQARQALGDPGFDTLRRVGEALDTERAMALAFAETDHA